MSEEMRTGFAGVVERLKSEGQLTRNSGANSLKSLRDTLEGELSNLGEGLENVSNSIAEASTTTPPPAPQSAADAEDAADQRNIFTRMLGTLGAIQRGISGGRDAVRDERGFGKLLGLFGAGLGGLMTALGPFVKLLKGGLILGAVYFALDTFEGILNFFEDPSLENLGNIFTSLGTTLLLVAAAFPKKTFSLITKVIPFVKTAFIAMKGFFLTTLMPMLTSFIAAITPIIVAAAPFIAIGAAIAFAFFSLYKGVEAFIDKFKETGSIMDGLIAMGTTILTLPFTLIKDLISYIADLLGFENFSSMLDSIDFAASAFEFISGLVDDIVGFFTGLFDIDFMEVIKKIPGADTVLKLIDKAASVGAAIGTFFSSDDKGAELEERMMKAQEREQSMTYAAAMGIDRETGQLSMVGSTMGNYDPLAEAKASIQVLQSGLELVSPEERKKYEDMASDRARKAEQAMEDYLKMPKLSDMIRNVTKSFKKIYRSIRESIEDFIDNIGNAIFKFFGFGEFDFTIFVMDPKTFLNYHVIMPITDLFNSIGNSITDFFNDMGQSLIEFLDPDTVEIFSELSPMDFIRNYIIDPIKNLFTDIGLKFFDFFGIDALPLFINDVSPIEFFKGFILDPIKNFFTNALTTVGEFFQSIMSLALEQP